jgi:hypothetical protein
MPMKHALGISSPSREFMEIGLAIPQGLALGIAGGTPAALAATNRMAMRLAGVGVGGLGASGGGMGAAGGGGAAAYRGEHMVAAIEALRAEVRPLSSRQAIAMRTA